MLRIGVISDTHGLLRPEAVSFLRGSSHIVHAFSGERSSWVIVAKNLSLT